MTDIWIVLIEDRHADVEPLPFSTEERAVAAARKEAAACAHQPDDVQWDAELTQGMRKLGWVAYFPYSIEGDCVRVVKRQMDGEQS